jgi:hypothetical protein
MDIYPGSDLKEKGFVCEKVHRKTITQKFVITGPNDVPWPDNRDIINFCNGGDIHLDGKVNHWITSLCGRV